MENKKIEKREKKPKKLKVNKTVIAFIIILLLQISVKIVIDYNKNGFFCDEMFSYGLMNYKQAYLFEEPTFEENWHNKEYYDEYITIQKDELFNFSQVYTNQVEDYHPPLYYFLLRIFSAFSVGEFTKWSGLILNIIIFIFCDIIIFKIGQKLFKNNWLALLLMTVYGFSLFSAENTLFIRMYQLLELELLLLTYWAIDNYKNKKINLKEYAKLTAIIMLGSLTHYYFLIFLAGFLLVYIIKLIKEHQFKNLAYLLLTILISQLLTFAIYPNYFKQITRGSGRNERKMTLENIISREQTYLNKLNSNMFFFYLKYIALILLIGLIICIVISIIKKRKIKDFKYASEMNVVIFPALIYWTYITLTSQFIALRYILPIFVFALIILFYIANVELATIMKNKKAFLCSMLMFSTLCIMPCNFRKIAYQYPNNKERYETIEKYKNVPVIYLYEREDVLNNDFMFVYDYVRRFDNCYIMNKEQFSVRHFKDVIKDVDTSNGVILIDYSIELERECAQILAFSRKFSNCENIVKLYEDRHPTVYIAFSLIK